MPAAVRETVLGEGGVAVEHPLSDGSAAQLQAGVVTCEWQVDGTPAARLHVDVLPNGVEDYRAFVVAYPYPGGTAAFGPDSDLRCWTDEVVGCSADLTPGGHWVEFEVSVPADAATGDASTAALQIGATITEALSTVQAGARGDLGDVLPAWDDCLRLDAGDLRGASGSPSLGLPEPSYAGPGVIFSVAWQRAAFRTCVWRQADIYDAPDGELRMLTVTVLPGGAWAWREVSDAAMSGVDVRPLDVPGADAASLACAYETECAVHLSVQGSLLIVNGSYDSVDDGDLEAVTEASAAAVVATLTAG
ncbi:hypothetical protein [Agromyces mariniharenae]|uniref:DUF3558 domain-containing protein n=1 Tax=Agromyces mariniharenae TaxID=2604423 RepID=A0A5S4VAE2_9MICO|nr:hypothetical protein [Agromyces mariniharenae]TYL51035.1 hypothetical protein FYC51_18050 [Agromyces mariniharenae]